MFEFWEGQSYIFSPFFALDCASVLLCSSGGMILLDEERGDVSGKTVSAFSGGTSDALVSGTIFSGDIRFPKRNCAKSRFFLEKTEKTD